jgi:hypothetical protein
VCFQLDCFTALPLRQDNNVGEEIILPTIDTVETTTSTSSTSVTSRTSTTISPVNDLLNAIFRQTIYTRIESLLLDPGRKSEEKQKIVDSAVWNYHRQKMFDSSVDNVTTKDENEDSSDISKSTGQSQQFCFVH